MVKEVAGSLFGSAAVAVLLAVASGCPSRPEAPPPPPPRTTRLDASCGDGEACQVGKSVRFRVLDNPARGFIYMALESKAGRRPLAAGLEVGAGVATVPGAFVPEEGDLKTGLHVVAWLVPERMSDAAWQQALATGTGPGLLPRTTLELMP